LTNPRKYWRNQTVAAPLRPFVGLKHFFQRQSFFS
jgi:hypothetical protein